MSVPHNHGQPWTLEDYIRLEFMNWVDHPVAYIAQRLERSTYAVQCKLEKMGLVEPKAAPTAAPDASERIAAALEQSNGIAKQMLALMPKPKGSTDNAVSLSEQRRVELNRADTTIHRLYGERNDARCELETARGEINKLTLQLEATRPADKFVTGDRVRVVGSDYTSDDLQPGAEGTVVRRRKRTEPCHSDDRYELKLDAALPSPVSWAFKEEQLELVVAEEAPKVGDRVRITSENLREGKAFGMEGRITNVRVEGRWPYEVLMLDCKQGSMPVAANEFDVIR